MSAALFEQFRKNLAVQNQDSISTSYCEITKRLNKDYWDSDSDTANSLQVGSYGRHTAIRGVSDLDMVFELPRSEYDRLKKVEGNGPSQLLQEVRKSLRKRYPDTEIKGDGQVVVVRFSKYVVEVLPAFLEEDGSYRYGDSNNGGSWNNFCQPRKEIDAVNSINARTNRNMKRVAKMLRAWKNTHGAPLSGMLIDTLTYNFFQTNTTYDSKSYASYPDLVRDIFNHLAELPEQAYWLAPGSRSRVDTSGKFQAKAKKAKSCADEALAAETDKQKHKFWKKIFGRQFPAFNEGAKAESAVAKRHVVTEEFIEDKFPVDVRYDLRLGYEVRYNGLLEETRMRRLEAKFPWLKLGRKLDFYVVDCNVPGDAELYWKVRNKGIWVERDPSRARGQILKDEGRCRRTEKTDFGGEHYVEAYVVQDGVCVARDRIDVPIEI